MLGDIFSLENIKPQTSEIPMPDRHMSYLFMFF